MAARRASRTSALLGLGALCLVAAVLLLVPPWRSTTVRPQPGNPARPPRNANVVIYLIDALRADRLGVSGYARPTSPVIDAIAAEGVVFEQAHACAPWTLPSITSLHTSTLPCEHQVLLDGQRVSESIKPLAERLREAGYATASYWSNPYAGPISGLHRGFEVSRFISRGDWSTPASWLGQTGGQPFFLYLQTMEAHEPWRAPTEHVQPFGQVGPDARRSLARLSKEYRKLTKVDYAAGKPIGSTENAAQQDAAIERLLAMADPVNVLYDGAVRWADATLGRFVNELERLGRWDDTLFIILADHGEEMGERGSWQHDQSVYEHLLHVPLIMRFPRGEFAGTRVGTPVTLLDVVPTILDYLRRPELAAGCRGESLMPRIESPGTGGDAPRLTAIRHNKKKYYRPDKEQHGDVNVVVRQAQRKGILNVELDTFELYDLDADPHERTNLVARETEHAARLRRFAREAYAACLVSAQPTTGSLADVSAETRRMLQSLGYIGGDQEAGTSHRPDAGE